MDSLLSSIKHILNQIKPFLLTNWKYIACYSAGSFVSLLFTLRFAYKLSGSENLKQFLFSIHLQSQSQKYNAITSKWRLSNYISIRPSSFLCAWDQLFYDICIGGTIKRQKWIDSSIRDKVKQMKELTCSPSAYDINPTLLGFGNNRELINKYIEKIDINGSGFRSLKINYPGTEKSESNEIIILGIHGGSNVGGAPEHYRSFLVLLSKFVNATCYSIGHGLAPDYIAPKQVDHIIDAYKYILNKHQNINKIFISGHSGGGNVALLTLQKLLKMKEKEKVRYPDGAIIISANVDRNFNDAPNKDRDCFPDWKMLYDVEHFAVGNIDINGKWKSEEEKVDLRDPSLSPLYGEIKGLCDLYVWVGLNDKLLPYNQELIKKCDENNVNIEYEINEWLPHPGPLLCDQIPEARDSVVRIAQWIKNKMKHDQP